MADERIGWATNELDGEGNPTKVIPPQEVQATGLLKNEPMGRQWFNYMLNKILNHIDPGPVPEAQATHQVRIYGTEQAQLELEGWMKVKEEDAPDSTSGKLYYYEHVGV